MNNRIKPLTLEETKLKEEMKSRCLNKGQYVDEKAEDKFKMLCHLEDFEIQYYNLLDVIKELRSWLEDEINICDGVISTRTSDFQELGGRSAGKTFIQNEILKNKVALKSFELALNKLNELEGGKND